jgi:hypothetical protein
MASLSAPLPFPPHTSLHTLRNEFIAEAGDPKKEAEARGRERDREKKKKKRLHACIGPNVKKRLWPFSVRSGETDTKRFTEKRESVCVLADFVSVSQRKGKRREEKRREEKRRIEKRRLSLSFSSSLLFSSLLSLLALL